MFAFAKMDYIHPNAIFTPIKAKHQSKNSSLSHLPGLNATLTHLFCAKNTQMITAIIHSNWVTVLATLPQMNTCDPKWWRGYAGSPHLDHQKKNTYISFVCASTTCIWRSSRVSNILPQAKQFIDPPYFSTTTIQLQRSRVDRGNCLVIQYFVNRKYSMNDNISGECRRGTTVMYVLHPPKRVPIFTYNFSEKEMRGTLAWHWKIPRFAT